MHRFLVGGFAALIVLSAVGPAAAAESRCAAPGLGDWHSCLSVKHRAGERGVELIDARPRLVIRIARCPSQTARRSVVIRTDGGRRLARATARGRCRRGVVRWRVDVPVGKELRSGTVVRSDWSGIPDGGKAAPGVKLTR